MHGHDVGASDALHIAEDGRMTTILIQHWVILEEDEQQQQQQQQQ